VVLHAAVAVAVAVDVAVAVAIAGEEGTLQVGLASPGPVPVAEIRRTPRTCRMTGVAAAAAAAVAFHVLVAVDAAEAMTVEVLVSGVQFGSGPVPGTGRPGPGHLLYGIA
jgi:hypothetical protein